MASSAATLTAWAQGVRHDVAAVTNHLLAWARRLAPGFRTVAVTLVLSVAAGLIANWAYGRYVNPAPASFESARPFPSSTAPTEAPRVSAALPQPRIVTVAEGWIDSYGKQHTVARIAGEQLYLFFGQGDRTQLAYSISSDGGQNWSAPALLGPQASSFQEPVAAVDSSGVVHLVWGGWNSDDVFYSQLERRRWSEPAVVGFAAFARNVAVDSANRPWVVWSSRDSWITRRDRGRWIDSEIVQENAWHPDVAIDSRDHVHVVYNTGGRYPRADVKSYHTEFDGRSWSKPTQLSGGPFWTGAVSMAVDTLDNLHVVFLSSKTVGGGQDVVIYTRFVNNSWQRAVLVGDLGESGGETGKEAPAIAIDRKGVAYVAWRGRNALGKRAIFVTALVPSGWTRTEEIANREASEVSWPSMGTGSALAEGVDLVWGAKVGARQVMQYAHIALP